MTNKFKIAYLALILTSVACVASKPQIMIQVTQNIREEVIESYPEKRPEWYLLPRDSDGKYDYFVGHSLKVSSEVGARDEAMVNAIKQFVRYCGVEVNIFDEYLKETTGRTSSVLAGVLSNKEHEQQKAQAFVTSIKPKEWYIRKVRIYHDETPISTGWKVSVLVKVPVEEKDRVQQYAEKKRKEKKIGEWEEHLDKVRKIEIALQEAAGYYKLAQDLINKKDILSALDILHKAEEIVSRLKSNEYYTEAKNNLHNKTKENVIDLIGIDKNRLLQGIALIKIAGDGQEINPDKPLPIPLTVKAVCNLEDDEIPLSHVQVSFTMEKEIINKTTTNKDGMAYLNVIGVPTWLKKNLRIIAALDIKPRREAYFNLIAKEPEMPKKEELSLDVNFMYEESGRPEKMWNGMSLRSRQDFYWIYFSPHQDCYVYIYQVDSSGAVYHLFPNLEYSNNWNPVKKDKSYWIPDNDRFYLDDVVGEERIYLLASKKPAAEIENMFAQLKAALDDESRREINNNIVRSLSFMAGTRGVFKAKKGNPHQVKSKSGKVFEVLTEKLQSAGSDFMYNISFMHE